MTTTQTNPGASARASDAITHSVAIAYCAIETIARGILAAYVLARSIHRAIAATRPAPAPLAPLAPLAPPYVHPLFETLAPLSNAQLRAVFNHARKSSNIALCALAVV